MFKLVSVAEQLVPLRGWKSGVGADNSAHIVMSREVSLVRHIEVRCISGVQLSSNIVTFQEATMTRRCPSVVLSILLTAVAGYALQNDSNNVKYHSLSGKVLNTAKEPIPNVAVYITIPGKGSTSVKSFTKADGSYTLANIPRPAQCLYRQWLLQTESTCQVHCVGLTHPSRVIRTARCQHLRMSCLTLVRNATWELVIT